MQLICKSGPPRLRRQQDVVWCETLCDSVGQDSKQSEGIAVICHGPLRRPVVTYRVRRTTENV